MLEPEEAFSAGFPEVKNEDNLINWSPVSCRWGLVQGRPENAQLNYNHVNKLDKQCRGYRVRTVARGRVLGQHILTNNRTNAQETSQITFIYTYYQLIARFQFSVWI